MSERIERPQPYIGVSGVVTPEQQEQLEYLADSAGLWEGGRVLALGVKATHKTQFLDVENKYGPEWYPVGEPGFSEALRPKGNEEGRTIGVAQTYLDVNYVSDPDYREAFTARLAERGQPWLQAIQFDMLPWHNDITTLGFLEKVKEDYDIRIFLQCHKAAMDEQGPRGVIRRLGHFSAAIDYLLFDSSHGTGRRLDTEGLGHFLEQAYSSHELATTGMAIAGGLDARTVREALPAVVEEYPDISWDAEGRLHPVNHEGKRPLDIGLVREYLQASADILGE
jgi:hypothetical protein